MTFELALTGKIKKTIFKKLEQFTDAELKMAIAEWVNFDRFFGGTISLSQEMEVFMYVLLFELAYREAL